MNECVFVNVFWYVQVHMCMHLCTETRPRHDLFSGIIYFALETESLAAWNSPSRLTDWPVSPTGPLPCCVTIVPFHFLNVGSGGVELGSLCLQV